VNASNAETLQTEPMAQPDTQWEPLSADDVTRALERRNPPRVPLVRSKWWTDEIISRHGTDLERFDQYPEDVESVLAIPIRTELMNLSWEIAEDGPIDERSLIHEWAQLDEFVEKFPDPANDPFMEALIRRAEKAHADSRYVLFGWWRLFFEYPWGIRGMTNLLTDFYDYPDEVLTLQSALLEQYKRYVDFAVAEIKPYGFWHSDDLGHQTGMFLSPEIYRTFVQPYYLQWGAFLKERNMHWWLHSCGHVKPILDDLIEAGVTIFHPVQKGTMDEVEIAREFGDRLSFLVGFDVQHILPEGSVEDVEREVRHLIDTFDRPDGGMCMGVGNGILSDTPLENIEAFIRESYSYGSAHRSGYQP
jgi:uroporphyrinogen decarboxylase